MHPAWWPGRDYANRPNVTSQIDGKGEGRSLLLSGHIDTVPLGTTDWSYDPFGAVVEDGKLYGLGSFDMKGGVAALLSAVRVIKELDIPLAGDLIAETVVDEHRDTALGSFGAACPFLGRGCRERQEEKKQQGKQEGNAHKVPRGEFCQVPPR